MKKSTIIIIIAFLLIISGALIFKILDKKETIKSEKISETACTMDYSPVCGVDGITYGNKCMAGQTEIAYDGECQDIAGGTFPVGEVPTNLSDEELAKA